MHAVILDLVKAAFGLFLVYMAGFVVWVFFNEVMPEWFDRLYRDDSRPPWSNG